MPSLTTHLPFAALKPLFDNARADFDVPQGWREQYQEHLRTIIRPALVSFFLELKAEGRLGVIPNSDGYACWFWESWNSAAKLTLESTTAADIDHTFSRLARQFDHYLACHIRRPYEAVLRTQDADAVAAFDQFTSYSATAEFFNRGTFPTWDFTHETCQITGIALTLGFENWAPQGCFIGKGGSVPVPPAPAAMLRETVLELKTGNLLVADWFRLPAFTKTVREKHFSLESRKGCEDQAEHLAQAFGVISVSITEAGPGVFQAGNQVMVGQHYEADGDIPGRFTHVGKPETDLWATTFVEYETLIDLVARQEPNAKEMVDAYIEEHLGAQGSYGLHRLTVGPGTYYLYHFGENWMFKEMAEKAGLALDTGVITPFFVFSPTRLSVAPTA